MVNLVIVSHSARLGEGVGELARQMLINDGCKLAIAAGIDDPDSPIGTDPLKVMEAIESVADTDHVLVMMDIGSALLSAETALDLLDPAIAAKVRLQSHLRGNRRIEQIEGGFGAEQRAADIHHHQHVIGIGHGFDRLHDFKRIGADRAVGIVDPGGDRQFAAIVD